MEYESSGYGLAAVHELMGMKRYKEALVEAEQVLREDPEDPDVFAVIAHIQLSLEDYGKALHWAEEALRRDPEQQLAWFIRVCAYYDLQNYKVLNETLPEAMRIDPYEPHYYFIKANVLNKRAKYKEAREELLQALELSPENAVYLATLSYTEALLGNMAESVSLDRQAVQTGVENEYVLLYLGWAAGHRGDYKLKETYMRNAVRLDPDDKQLRDEFLESLQQTNKLLGLFLWPTKYIRRLKRWQILTVWIVAWIVFRPLVLLLLLLYIIANLVTKGIVHVQVYGWRRRGK
ncbi:tetratricopeptide repeat protein [Paenibacillus sp. FSL R7-0345]|uniref:tetratricopeptide repeat protein n=1 Tax=Paenibacillus sp. FSL R7-0345 TaxID=2954535 RepID=UPI00315B2352